MGTQDQRRDEGKPHAAGGEGRANEPHAPEDQATTERYPSVRQDDSVEAPQPAGEGRSFEGETADPQPRRGGGQQAADPSVHHGGMGAEGDPDEGER